MLSVAFPMAPGELLLMAILLVLPMGWTESPPYFCTTTETIVDLANLYSHSTWDPPSHPLEVPSATAALWDGHLTITVPPPNLQADRQPKTVVRLCPSHPVTTTGTHSPLCRCLHRRQDPSHPRSCSRSQQVLLPSVPHK